MYKYGIGADKGTHLWTGITASITDQIEKQIPGVYGIAQEPMDKYTDRVIANIEEFLAIFEKKSQRK